MIIERKIKRIEKLVNHKLKAYDPDINMSVDSVRIYFLEGEKTFDFTGIVCHEGNIIAPIETTPMGNEYFNEKEYVAVIFSKVINIIKGIDIFVDTDKKIDKDE